MLSRSITSSPSSMTGSVGPARRSSGAEAGEQLLDPERLRHVVVRAGVERRDLLALLADDREHDDRRRRVHVRRSRQTSTPLPSGRTRSRMTASGGRAAALASASAAVAAVSTS